MFQNTAVNLILVIITSVLMTSVTCYGAFLLLLTLFELHTEATDLPAVNVNRLR